MSRKKKAVLTSITSLLLQVATLISGLIVPRLIILSFGSEINGLVSSAAQFLSYITLLEAGIGGVARAALYGPLAKKNKNEVSRIILSTEKFFRKIAMVFLVYLIILATTFKFISGTSLEYVFVFGLVIAVGFSNFIQYYFGISYQILLQADQRKYIISIIQIVTIIVNAVLVWLAIKLGFNIIGVKIISSAVYIVRPLCLHYYVRKKYSIQRQSGSLLRLKQKWDGLAQHIAFFLHTNTDIVVITLFLNVTSVSVYAVYNMITSGLRNLVVTLGAGAEAIFGDMLAKGELLKLKKEFNFIEFTVSTATIITFSTAAVMIDDFINIYMHGVTDANYSVPWLGYMLLAAEAMYCLRLGYNELAIAAGHFKETKAAAFLEAGVNIALSLILVKFVGIVGVAIATFIAMTLRTVFLVFYFRKRIIYKPVKDFFIKRLGTAFASILMIIMLKTVLSSWLPTSYLEWACKGFLSFIAISLPILGLSTFLYPAEIRELKSHLYRHRNR